MKKSFTCGTQRRAALARMQGLVLISYTIYHRTKDSPICGIGWHKRPKDTILIKYRDNNAMLYHRVSAGLTVQLVRDMQGAITKI